ncbi:MAG: hypothetical protein EU539_09535, partial [Promethearchaeota archaeon]
MPKLYLINKGELNEIKNPVFSKGDVYLLDDQNTIYVWIGSKCSVDEKTAGAASARKLDQERGGAAKIITVDEGQETAEFLKAVASMGAMKIVSKNIAKTMLKDVVTGDWAQFAEHKNVLYRVSSEEFEDINAMKMIQVPYNKSSLDSEDCFVADLGNKVYIWQGNSCSVKEKVKAGQWARKIDADRAGLQNEVIFDEGDDEKFLTALDKGEDYKESDAVQLRAESELEPETQADKAAETIQPEHKTEIKEVVTETLEEETSTPELKKEISSSAAPGMPGQIDESIMTIEKVEGRRKCPKCGNEDKLMIHESVDKSNIILDYPRMYGKKYRCGLCGCL